MACLVKVAMRLCRGEALVPQMHDDGKFCAKLFAECLRLCGLRALVAGHVEWVSDNGFKDMMLAEHAGDSLQVCAAVGAMQCKERLRGEPKGIGKRNADAPVADVEADNAGRQRTVTGARFFYFRVKTFRFFHTLILPVSG